MNDSETIREYSIHDDLPTPFVQWLCERVVNKQTEKKGFIPIAQEIGVDPSLFSRWIGGKGPLNKSDIGRLANIFGRGVYITLGLKTPDNN